jgi:hypothetical protein
VKGKIAVLTMALAFGGCDRAPGFGDSATQLDVRWTGGEQGRLSGGATAEWCSILRMLEIRSVRGDTGFAIAVYPKDTLVARPYRVVDPARADSLRPAAAVVLRWAGQTSIKGFQGDSGSVVLDLAPSGELSGRVTAVARSVTDTQTVTIEGNLKGLRIRPQRRGCIARSEPSEADAQPSDTSLH